jgi:nicotinamidase-related amidase
MTDLPFRDAPTRDALIALHFQNDICHPQGRIPFSLDRGSSEAARFLDASKRALGAARHAGWTIVHMHIVFAEDYSDLLRNCPLFQKAEALGALKRGSWGAAPFDGFEPRGGEIFVAGNGNSAFRRTGLEGRLGELAIERVNVIGLATQFSVEHTVRDETWATASGCLPIAALPATSRPIAHRCAR